MFGGVLFKFIISLGIVVTPLLGSAKIIDNASSLKDCYQVLMELRTERLLRESAPANVRIHQPNKPLIVIAHGTDTAIADAFEKEGLFYQEIETWFPDVKEKAFDVLSSILRGKTNPLRAKFLRWLDIYPARYKPSYIEMTQEKWRKLDPIKKLAFLAQKKPNESFMGRINTDGKEALFHEDILSFNDLNRSPDAPNGITVGWDDGSYEVRSDGGTTDRNRYFDLRDEVESYLEGMVGHQHKLHQWPKDDLIRQQMAAKYIEMIKAEHWYLFWRQAFRDPEAVDSIVGHPYLGVYPQASLERLYRAVVSGDPNKFRDKYRMIGARSFRADPKLGQEGEFIPSLEIRSGNKSNIRDEVEDRIEARIASGDFTGFRNFNSYEFDPATELEKLLIPYLDLKEVLEVKGLEDVHPWLFFNKHPRAHNQIRNKVIAPLLPWDRWLPMDSKVELLKKSQREFAKGLLGISKQYSSKLRSLKSKVSNKAEYEELLEQSSEELEDLVFEFAGKVRLETDLKRYVEVAPRILPEITVPVPEASLLGKTVINTNEIDIGIENSFRFASRPKNKSQAEKQVLDYAEELRARQSGGMLERLSDGGHGHGLSVRYRFRDPDGNTWRVEWDGVVRSYSNGRPVHPRGGHIEVPTPKKTPKSPNEFRNIFAAARHVGVVPKRRGGGGHFNSDLKPLFDLPNPKEGAQKVANLIRLYQREREMIAYLWRHPKRMRVAAPVYLSTDAIARLDSFNGDWDEIGKLLYEIRFFNTRIGRKPRYVEMDVTGLITPVAPLEYRADVNGKNPLDIKNPTQEWYPEFTEKSRIELRLLDAALDEYILALQIKYIRALENAAYNGERASAHPLFEPNAREIWNRNPLRFLNDAKLHFERLGLDINEFQPLLYDAMKIQKIGPVDDSAYPVFDKFIPLSHRLDHDEHFSEMELARVVVTPQMYISFFTDFVLTSNRTTCG